MKTFYFFGDSITLGVNVIAEDVWTGLVATHLTTRGLPVPPTTFYNLGVRKNSSKLIAERFNDEFKRRTLPETEAYFVIMCGNVDMAMPQDNTVLSVDESLAETRKILDLAKIKGTVLFLSGTPVKNEEHNARISKLALLQNKLCDELHIEFINLHDALSQNPTYLQDLTDGVHPQEMGNAAISDLVCQSKTMQDLLNQ